MLIIDIGTNGEVVLGSRHRLLSSSCATGPAFEGA
ncbi:MAG: ASKHA domain-containing protein [Thermacetogeniaceae bacterium]